jgi:hypothetical protein
MGIRDFLNSLRCETCRAFIKVDGCDYPSCPYRLAIADEAAGETSEVRIDAEEGLVLREPWPVELEWMQQRENSRIWSQAMEDVDAENARLGARMRNTHVYPKKSEKDPWFVRLAIYVAKKTSKE